MNSEFVFVYNANTDVINAMVDYAHKVFKPSTYKCDLCALTHHNLGQRSAWKKFKENSCSNFSFWYIRQFEKAYSERYEYPVVLKIVENGFELLLSRSEIAKLKSVEQLINKLEIITRK